MNSSPELRMLKRSLGVNANTNVKTVSTGLTGNNTPARRLSPELRSIMRSVNVTVNEKAEDKASIAQ